MAVKHVTLIGAACLTLGWLLASTLTPPVARVQSLPPAPATAQPAASVQVPETKHLHVRLKQNRPLPQNRRNPFIFATPARATLAPPAEPGVLDQEAAEPTPMPTGPAFVLSGIGIHGSERTAVLAVDDTVSIVRVNDVLGAFTVTAIGDDSITLMRGDERFVLRLAP
jgi:hypothetical protein